MRLFKKILLALAAVILVAALTLVFWARDRYVVPILTYHNVSGTLNPKLLNNVSPEAFARQMKFIKKRGYHVISFDDYVQGLKRGYAFGHNTVVIHFDDGYDDNYTNAFPVLRQYKFPASVFLISDLVGKPGYLTWDQVREMEAHGVAAGSHTRHHLYLPDQPLDVAREEIFGSKKVIEAHLGHPVDYFVYPSGGFTQAVRELVEEAGYQAAGTTNRGRDRFNRERFELNRIRLKTDDSTFVLWAKLSGYYNLFRKSRCGDACK